MKLSNKIGITLICSLLLVNLGTGLASANSRTALVPRRQAVVYTFKHNHKHVRRYKYGHQQIVKKHHRHYAHKRYIKHKHYQPVKKVARKKHHFTIKRHREPKLIRIHHYQVGNAQVQEFTKQYQVMNVEPVKEYNQLYSQPQSTIDSGTVLQLKGAVYNGTHHQPIGFELANGDYIPSYAVIYDE